MIKRSAGILVYKIEDNVIKVLLGHMGGPYWQDVENGSWSIPKGEFKNETSINAAKREFTEETGLMAPENLNYLSSKKVSNNKIIIIFYSQSDYDTNKTTSNTFTLEWPKGSGIIKEFKEIDKVEWMDINIAKEKILKNQVYFFNKLEEKLSGLTS